MLREVNYFYNASSQSWTVRWDKDSMWAGARLLAAVSRTEGMQHYHVDHLGSPRMVTNRCGRRTTLLNHNPWELDRFSGTQHTEWQTFTAHQRDSGIADRTRADLDSMHARYYNPTIARFVSVDPFLGDPLRPQSWNLYSYVSGNPLRLVDPWGLAAEEAIRLRFTETITVTAEDRDKEEQRRANEMMLRMTLSQFFRTPSGAAVRWQTSFPMPRNVNLAQNIALAKQQRVDHWYAYRAIYNAVWMINRVRTGGQWDYKRLSPTGTLLYEPFGNFHYGVVMTSAGWPPWLTRWGAGAYQAIFGPREFAWSFSAGVGANIWQWPTVLPPHGDDPGDQLMISLGIAYYQGAVEGEILQW